jgi:hypothetical protein
MKGHHFLKRVRLEKRNVSAQNQDFSAEAVQKGLSACDGVPGTQLLFLKGKRDIVISREPFANFFGLMSDNGDYPARARSAGGFRGIVDHRAATDFMQYLDQVRFHPGPLARCENDCS